MNPTVRNLRFDIDGSVPQYWLGGRRSVTIFLDNLSVFFPAGERFFVRAVRAHQAFVKSDGLTQEVRAFCGQEGVHGREHERYNEMLRSHYPIEAMEKRVQAILTRVSKRTPDLGQLGVTCALEHFTALLGGMILARSAPSRRSAPCDARAVALARRGRERAQDGRVRRLHGRGRRYPMRVSTMIGATVIFWAKVIEQQARMMHASGILFSLESGRRSVDTCSSTPAA